MATTLIAKTTSSSAIGKSSSLFRISFSFLRNLSTTTPTPSSAGNEAADGGAEKLKPKRKKKKNLIEVAQFLPNWGIGYHMAKSHWNGLSYEITKINLYKDGRHGKAWGIAHKNGAVADAPKKISGVHKRCWKYIPIPKRIEESASKQELETVA